MSEFFYTFLLRFIQLLWECNGVRHMHVSPLFCLIQQWHPLSFQRLHFPWYRNARCLQCDIMAVQMLDLQRKQE